MQLHFSFIIPVYNRPEEVQELLESFIHMEFNDPYEIIIVEDGSTKDAKDVVKNYSNKLSISYYSKENTGPGDSRNFGMQRANGNYFIILDSDCLVPSHYLKTVAAFLNANFYHCYGGADAADKSFSKLQKAINYTMTSFVTTGGIRGSKKRVQSFEPRSFNMGLSKEVFEATNGFGNIHPGEDPDLSQRIKKMGYKTTFLPNAYVYHKRRISWRKFYNQVQKFGLVRPILNKWHPESSKITFWFPTLFVGFCILSILLTILLSFWFIVPLAFYCLLIFIDASIKNKNLIIGFFSVIAMFVQFFGYGIAFLKAFVVVNLLGKDPHKQFPNLFFK